MCCECLSICSVSRAFCCNSPLPASPHPEMCCKSTSRRGPLSGFCCKSPRCCYNHRRFCCKSGRICSIHRRECCISLQGGHSAPRCGPWRARICSTIRARRPPHSGSCSKNQGDCCKWTKGGAPRSPICCKLRGARAMSPGLSIADIVARLEAQLAVHQEKEAFHAGQEALHREQRSIHAAEVEKL